MIVAIYITSPTAVHPIQKQIYAYLSCLSMFGPEVTDEECKDQNWTCRISAEPVDWLLRLI
jgi:hypothetical protein